MALGQYCLQSALYLLSMTSRYSHGLKAGGHNGDIDVACAGGHVAGVVPGWGLSGGGGAIDSWGSGGRPGRVVVSWRRWGRVGWRRGGLVGRGRWGLVRWSTVAVTCLSSGGGHEGSESDGRVHFEWVSQSKHVKRVTVVLLVGKDRGCGIDKLLGRREPGLLYCPQMLISQYEVYPERYRGSSESWTMDGLAMTASFNQAGRGGETIGSGPSIPQFHGGHGYERCSDRTPAARGLKNVPSCCLESSD